MSDEEDYSLSFLDYLGLNSLTELSEKMGLEVGNKKKNSDLVKLITENLGYCWIEKGLKFIKLRELKSILESIKIKNESSKKNVLIKDILIYIKEHSLMNLIRKLDEEYLRDVICEKLLYVEYENIKQVYNEINLAEMEYQLQTSSQNLLWQMCKENKLNVNDVSHNKWPYCLLEQRIITKTPVRGNKKKETESESSEEESVEAKKKRNKRKRSSTNGSSKKEGKNKEEKKKGRRKGKKEVKKEKEEKENVRKSSSKSKKKKSKKNEEEIESSEEKSSLDGKQDDNDNVQKNLLNTLNNDNRAYTITGKLSLKRNTLIDLIKKRGYEFTEDIDKATHVVSNDPFYNTKKIVFARKHKIPIIHDSYFADSK